MLMLPKFSNEKTNEASRGSLKFKRIKFPNKDGQTLFPREKSATNYSFRLAPKYSLLNQQESLIGSCQMFALTDDKFWT